jgi:serine/threonine protein phosphatase PrpC
MGVTAKWRSGVASDPGRVRSENEDRYYIDDERGLFMVVDGVGGHAGGEIAAEIAVDVIRAKLTESDGNLSSQIRQAIASANNEIYQQASSDLALHGMACVLTLAVIRGDTVTVGHVGDSRLYLIWNGAIRKLTSDHSPVGEREESGELSEEEAMQHPRRHEVFRDVGSRPRAPEEEEFVDIKEFPMKPDAALLLCSDGLSDCVPSAHLSEIIERYDGHPDATAVELVEAANQAGGSDNVTAIFVAGSEFLGTASAAMTGARERHAITRERPIPIIKPARSLTRLLTGRVAFLIYGLILGLLLALRFR